MDCGKDYILMCQKAEEIQGKTLSDDDYCIVTDGKQELYRGLLGLHKEPFLSPVPVKCIWLPRQDQLQEMIESPAIEWLLDKFWYWARQEHNISPTLNSMEQLWLAFVQKELHQKVWDGEEWKSLVEVA